METEFEAKFLDIDKQQYRDKLKSIGAVLVSPERKMRRVIVDRRVNKQFLCDYIRVRDEGDCVRLSAKTHARENGNIEDQKEVDVVVSDYDKTIEIIKLMGFNLDKYQETLRETWEYGGAEITIDTWPGLDTYSEIEASSEAKVKEIAEKLELDWNKKRITSITEIFMQTYNLGIDETLEKLSNITFENNPFTQSQK